MNRNAAVTDFQWIIPTTDEIADGSAEWLEKDAHASSDLVMFVCGRAQEDADLSAGPLFATLVFSELPVPREALTRYLGSIRRDAVTDRRGRASGGGARLARQAFGRHLIDRNVDEDPGLGRAADGEPGRGEGQELDVACD